MSKKKRPSRKQVKEQRRAAIERKRMETGWEAPPPPSVARDQVVEEMLPLFPDVDDTSAPLSLAMEEFMTILLDSADLAEEPEFEEIFVEPLLCADTFAKAGLEMGHDPDTLLELPDEERQDAQLQILIETIKQLLDDDLRRKILDGLEQLQSRWKEAGEQKEAARAAALKLFLDQSSSHEMWAMIGLVQAIVHRSIVVGFELAETSLKVLEAKDAGEEPTGLIRRLAQSSLGKKVETLLGKVPGLSRFMAEQADKTWDEGLAAIYEGDLYLGLFSEEELIAGAGLLKTAFKRTIPSEETSQKGPMPEPPEEAVTDLLSSIDRYLTKLLTPERLDQLRARLDAVLSERGYDEEWLAFLFMLREYMADQDAAVNEKPFLVTAFLGEIRVVAEAAIETEDEVTEGDKGSTKTRS